MKLLLATLLFLLPTLKLAQAAPGDLAYFKKFLYQEKVDDTDPEDIKRSYRFVMTEYDKKIPLANGDSLGVAMSLFLLDNGTYTVVYRESLFPAGSNGIFYPKGCKQLQGNWSVPEDKLVLEGIGYAKRARFMNQIAIELVVENQIISSEAQGLTTFGTLGFSNTGINEVICF